MMLLFAFSLTFLHDEPWISPPLPSPADLSYLSELLDCKAPFEACPTGIT